MIEEKRVLLNDMLQMEHDLGFSFHTRADDFITDATGFIPVDEMNVLIVAKKGDGGSDWAAYMGYPVGTKVYIAYLSSGLDLNNPATVQTNGDKIYQALAEKLFPNFVEAGLEYRR